MSEINLDKEEILKTASFFRLAYYRVTKEGHFLECDAKAREIFGIPQDAKDLSEYSIADMYAIPAEREQRMKMLNDNKLRPFSDTISVTINGKKKILFDVCWYDEQDCITGLVREMEESNLLHSVRAIDRMPTGFYHIKHAENDLDHKRERITQCNDRFAQILGFRDRGDAIGKNIVELFHTVPGVGGKFFRDLYKTDKNGKPLQNYPFETKSFEHGKTIYLSLDVHLIKDNNGKVTGREGTIRDVTREIKLRNQVKNAEDRLEKTTADINKLIHSFLHPVVKFSGNAELFHQVGTLLQKTTQPVVATASYDKESGKKLLGKIIGIRDGLPEIAENISYEEAKRIKHDGFDPLVVSTLKEKLTVIINIFDHSLQTEASKILLANSIRDTALWVLEELNKIDYDKNNKIKSLITDDFIGFLQGILFDQLTRGANILMAESKVMKRKVESLRAYIGMEKERKISVVKRDIRRILEENVERFRPIFLEKEIEIDYKASGNLVADISTHDIDRVISNILDNARKYSYGGKGRSVKIRARELQPDNVVEFSIESFGTPIKKEEIESGKIWEFGYRSELVYSTDRDGTGVGLADVKDTIEAHGGEIGITSRPVGKESDPPHYKIPYVTEVTIRIPKQNRTKKE
ncbi:MAG: PAS domain-containing protein [Candidatus Aminicenantes bacterium]|nr:PAS domain-containing protein [Candidatus Aminicenantes bacterium]